jgi:hypothetical protein
MLLRYSHVLLSLLLLLACTLPVKAADDQEPSLRRVRVIYLVSRDRDENVEYTAAIEHAIRDLQKWYARQLSGPTFRLSDPAVEVVKSNRPADWFYGNPNGNHQDNWGYNNTFAEAKQLRGANHNDPMFVWVVYSDGPGNMGRGGSGVTCLPEDDLLGLIGKHPTQKDKLRWIAGLGHELGHAFGLPHPSDTKKHADAIMWAGIYGKYPDKTYLTHEDKQILMRSPFFYHKNGTPVFQKGKVVVRYTYRGGAFEQHAGKDPIYWTETKTDSDASYTFEESRRDTEYIFLNDRSRGIAIRLPVNGGRSSFSNDNGTTWQSLYQIMEPMQQRP